MNYLMLPTVVLMGLLINLSACSTQQQANANNKSKTTMKDAKKNTATAPEGLEIATLGAGCFWCVEAIFQELKGVEKVVSGYTGGEVDNPTYKAVCNGTTGHAEVAQITFDPSVISFADILKVFWTTHNPTTLNRQGADVGTQYRSAIFYHSEAQKAIAEKSRMEVAPTLWENPIVTEISPIGDFYLAENYHQNYFSLNPNQGYCRAVINPKVQKFRVKFKDLLKENSVAE